MHSETALGLGRILKMCVILVRRAQTRTIAVDGLSLSVTGWILSVPIRLPGFCGDQFIRVAEACFFTGTGPSIWPAGSWTLGEEVIGANSTDKASLSNWEPGL